MHPHLPLKKRKVFLTCLRIDVALPRGIARHQSGGL
jgi:hypothetical protein